MHVNSLLLAGMAFLAASPTVVEGYAVRNQTATINDPDIRAGSARASRGGQGPGSGSGARIPLPPSPGSGSLSFGQKIKPKIVIFSLFPSEGNIWYDRWSEANLGDLDALETSFPGSCMLYPYIHCTTDHSVCQVTTGMGEINAASTAMALGLSSLFDLTSTYFLVAGIGGVNPQRGTLGSVAIARFAVQVALQYELDGREIPSDWPTGYVAYGTKRPLEFPRTLYGSEVFELNDRLQEEAFRFAEGAALSDSEAAGEYRAKYKGMGSEMKAAVESPTVLKCDTATSDLYFSGKLLAEAFERTSEVWTNGSAKYCMTASEDNAILEVLVRLGIEGIVDFNRVMVLRAGSNFDRPPTGISAYQHLLVLDQNGFSIAIDNIFNAGIKIIRGILKKWDCTFVNGVAPTGYVGDVWGSLGGQPGFGPGSITGGKKIQKGGMTGTTLMRRGQGAEKLAKAVMEGMGGRR